jgi:hypothetical protein
MRTFRGCENKKQQQKTGVYRNIPNIGAVNKGKGGADKSLAQPGRKRSYNNQT